MKIFIIFFCAIFIPSTFARESRNTERLWEIVHNECVPHQAETGNPAPCLSVHTQGYVVLKDLRGPLHLLILPTEKITGIESSDVLKDSALNYFDIAWHERSVMEDLYHGPIPDEEIALAINSQKSRSQNQLHVHISCVRTDVKALVQKYANRIDQKWNSFPQDILGHGYIARRLTQEELQEKNVFQLLAELPGAKENMGEFGLGLVPIKNADNRLEFIMLTYQANFNHWGGVEEIQDHKCAQLF